MTTEPTVAEATAVRCPHCQARPGQPCHSGRGLSDIDGTRRAGPHPERFIAARELEVVAVDPPPLGVEELRRELAGIREAIEAGGRLVPVEVGRRVRDLEQRLEETDDIAL